jgi:NADPH:quinone reductase-like Zn-dependent oxidoreductase
MQAYKLKVEADRTTVELKDAPRPVPNANQVLVRVHAAGLNRGEFLPSYHSQGQSATVLKPAGNEAAGEIVALGADVRNLKLGARVMGRAPGAFAPYAVMGMHEAMPMPAGLSWEEAAGIPLTYTVVYDMLVAQGRLISDEWLLVIGISSGVGVAALQMAKALGAKVIGTSRSSGKLARLEKHGLDVGLCTAEANFADAIKQATGGKGADLVVNAVGGSMFAEGMRALAFEGRFATVGYVDGVTESLLDIDDFHTRRLSMFGSSNKLRSPEQRVGLVRNFIKDIVPMFANGRIQPIVDEVYPFARLEAAKAHMESNSHVGKIVLAMDH